MMDYPCGKFGDCNFSRFLGLSCGQTDTNMETHTDAGKRFTPATVVGVSKYQGVDFHLCKRIALGF